MSRATITGLYICAYVLAVNAWIYLLANGQLTLIQNRVSGYAISLFMVGCLFADLKQRTLNHSHNQFINVAFSTLIINFITHIINWTGVLGYDAPNMFITFNGLVLVVTSLIIYWGRRHGLFNE